MTALLYIPLSVHAGELLNARRFPIRTPFEETRFSNAQKKLLSEVPDVILRRDVLEAL
jgi:hypothetical protein